MEYFQIIKENHILRDFYRLCDKNGLLLENIGRIRDSILDKMDINTLLTTEMWLPSELWSLASLAQHYGLPTRLLDWTHDINVALFFACEDYLNGKILPKGTEKMVLWALNLQPIIEPIVSDLPLKLVQPIYHGNDNLTAQKGLFTLWQVKKNVEFKDGQMVVDRKARTNRKPLDQLLLNLCIRKDKIDKPYLYCFKLPKDSAKEIYRYIKGQGYDASRIYPGYNGVVKSMKHDYYLNQDAIECSAAIMIARS